MFKKLLTCLLFLNFFSCTPATKQEPVACDFSIKKKPITKSDPESRVDWFSDRTIKWQPYNRTSIQIAVSVDSIILLLIIQDGGCSACDIMLDSFKDPAVKSQVMDKFTPIKLDVSKNPEAATALGIEAVPIVAFIDSDFKVIGAIEGAVPPEVLLEAFDYVVEKKNSKRKSSHSRDGDINTNLPVESERELEKLERL